ncbi:MAG: hypothetical protein H9Q67_06265 [Spiroplasma ixodetis]|nr:hypothetical protein [Spiroplasma ixodetis]
MEEGDLDVLGTRPSSSSDSEEEKEEKEEKKCILTIIFFFKFIWNFRRLFKCINGRSKRTSCPS